MIVRFEQKYAPYFESLNREWMERYFQVEPKDEVYFRDPVGTIIKPGGMIFFALREGTPVGTAAALRHDETTFELAKMAVTPSAQGHGYGRLLGEAVIQYATAAGARQITVISDTKLPPAVKLYERLGFEHRPLPPDTGYTRGDIYMVLELPVS